MTVAKFLITLGVVTVFSWLAWVTAVFYIDPDLSGNIGIFVFYASLFFSLLGTFTLMGLGIRIALKKLHHNNVVAFHYVSPSIRQAIWFSSTVIISLMLLAAKLFTWWSVSILLVGLIILEGFYLTKKTGTGQRLV